MGQFWCRDRKRVPPSRTRQREIEMSDEASESTANGCIADVGPDASPAVLASRRMVVSAGLEWDHRRSGDLAS